MALIQAFLARPVPKLQLQPFVPVVDRWWGMAVLACGHLLSPNSTISSSHNRRCRFCGPVTPASNFRIVTDEQLLDWFAAMSDEARGAAIRRLFEPAEDV
ncbi:hypothetical protein MF271_22265 (plasmid) [Deinococcus sp. KNUC1210]|uniref:hypothetical protein n=1 Tax=Deinococcus sp. KNUC1210 TaxID=2917691 RepID=UPI001EEF7FAA|nr:hypothetical protein [Deinococcus sp. KNUC1210]ULH18197.1 hypothetical protein MF271_22265 [Deinococcus sp. KNUC1210]